VFPNEPALDPAGQALSLEAWCYPDGGNGILVQHGGPQQGICLELRKGKPVLSLRRDGGLSELTAPRAIDENWHHIVATLGKDGTTALFVDGDKVAEGKAGGTIPLTPQNGLTLGNARLPVGELAPTPYRGLLDQFALYHRALTLEEVRKRFDEPDVRPENAFLSSSFDNGDARDESGKLHGILSGVDTGKGRVGAALWFRGTPGGKKADPAPKADSLVQRKWDRYVPIVTRSMTLAGGTVIVAGPPDTLDEEYAFERLTQKDANILTDLVKQDENLQGLHGAKLWAVNGATGEQQAGFDLDSPPVWDGMAVSGGCLFVATENGKVIRFGTSQP
jgi:hypothetical protein